MPVQSKLFAAATVAVLLLQGCAHKQVVVAPAAEPYDEAYHAAKCTVDPNPVRLGTEQKITVKMSVGNDGGWCAVRMAQVKAALLRTVPQHGKAYFRNIPDRDLTRLQYTPASGFTGTDSFTFQLVPSGAKVVTTVTVTPQ